VRPSALVLVAVAVLAVPGTASAHGRTARVAVDYAATVAPLRPPLVGAVQARVYKADLALGLTLLGPHRVVVLGYSGEPFVRLVPGGAYVNEASVTASGLGLVARPGSGWRLRSREPRLIWHDTRLRGLPQGVERQRWSLPLLVDGARTELRGELRRVSPPSAWPWLAIGAAFAAAVAVLLALRSQGLLRTASVALGWVAAVATLLFTSGFAAAPTASEATWVETGNEMAFVVLGVAFLVAGSRDTRALAGGALGLLALAIGLTSMPVFLHGLVLSALPGDLARAAVAIAISAGGAAMIVGAFVFFDVLEHYEEPASIERYL
jgi:hypothetical protein